MAFNPAVFKTRALSAIVFVIVMVGGIVWNDWSFFILFSIIHFGCWIEYQKLVNRIDPEYAGISGFHRYGVMIAGWCILLYFTRDHLRLFGIRFHELGWWMGLLFMFVLPIVELLFARQMRLKNIAHSTLGLIYISLSWGLFMDLYDFTWRLSNQSVPGAKEPFAILHFDHAWFLPVIVIACMWINDTMAYLVGSFIGKTPFSKISPKKTWEGTIGGILLCVAVVGWLLSSSWIQSFEPIAGRIHAIHWFIIALLAAIAGTAGDLFESKLKRLAGVKDSGQIMPGHGGFLDRFDSLLFAAPVVWLYINLVIQH